MEDTPLEAICTVSLVSAQLTPESGLPLGNGLKVNVPTIAAPHPEVDKRAALTAMRSRLRGLMND